MSKKHIHGGDVVGAAQNLGLVQDEILDFSANINPLGPPQDVFDAISNNMEKIVHYPDPHCRELKKALSEYLGVNSRYIIPGNGVAELIFLLVKVLKSKRAIIPIPTFTEYAIAMETSGGRVEEILLKAENEFKMNITDVEDLKLYCNDIIFLCNPNNPTGNLYSPDLVQYLLKKAEAVGAYLVLDEAFMDFVDNIAEYSFIKKPEENDNLIVFYSLTKFFAIPGLRLGSMIGHPDIINKMIESKDPWNVNLFAQVGGVAALKNSEYRKKTRELIKTEREYLFNELLEIPELYPHPCEANFLIVDITETGFSSTDFSEQMAGKGVLVRECNSFRGLGNEYIRLAVKKRDDNNKLLSSIKSVLEGASQ